MSKSVIVVGAGIVGSSIAYSLSRAGCAVTVIEHRSPGGLATAASFAWINASWGNPRFYFDFRRRSMQEWRRLGGEIDGLGVNFCGGLIWDLPPAELDAYAKEHASWGYGVRRVDAADALRIEPALAQPPELALHVAEEGMVEPTAAARAMLRASGARPVTAKVAALATLGDRITGVDTDIGSLSADEVVVAAGSETSCLLDTAGVSMELDTPPGLIVHTKPLGERWLNGLVLAPELHVRQTAEGRIIAGSDFSGTLGAGSTEEAADRLFAKVRSFMRGGERLQLDHATVGYRPTPKDGFPLIGRPAGREGLYVAVMHSGVTLAPIVGMLAADEIASGRRDPMLEPYGLEREPLA